MCDTCLSSGRRVAPLGSLRRVCTALLERQPSADTRVCWECAALLRRAAQFRLRAARAHAWLAARQPEPPEAKSASSLGPTQPSILVEIFDIPPNDPTNVAPKEELEDDFDFSASDQYVVNEDDVKCFKVTEPELEPDPWIQLSEIKKELKAKRNVKKKLRASKNKHKDLDVKFKPKSKGETRKKKISISKCENVSESMGVRGKRGRGRPASKMIIRILNMSEMENWREKLRNRETFLNAKYKCTRCLRILKEDTYADHLVTLHESKTLKWRCDICELQFETKHLLRKHIPTHFKLYNCSQCSLSGVSARFMYHHYHINHVLKRIFNCTTCSAKYTQWIEFKEHLKEHRKTEKENVFECDKCGKKFMTRMMIKKHLRSHEKYECSQCKRTYVSKGNLDLHCLRKHTKAPVLSEVYCVECNKQFYTVLSFEGHIQTVHSSKVKVRVPCTVCNLTFANNFALRHHYNFNHLKVTDYHCGPCNKYFYSNDSLHCHKRRVHDQVPLPKNRLCTICGRGFSSKKILVNHIRTHTGERPYECEHCKAAFAQRTAWKQHEKRVHLRLEKNVTKDSG